MNKRRLDTMKKVFKRLGKYRAYLIFSVFLATLTVALTLYIPKLIGEAVDVIIAAGNVQFDVLMQVLVKIAICTGIIALSQWFMNISNNKMTYHIVRDVRNEAFAKIERLSFAYIDGHSHGDVVSRVISDVDQFADGLLMGFTQSFTAFATIIGTFLFMLSIDVKITLVVVMVTPASIFVANFIAKRTFDMFKAQSEARGEQTGLIEEMIGHQKIVQAFGQGEQVLRRFDEGNEELKEASMRATFFSSLTNPCTRFVNSLVYTSVGIVGAYSVISGGFSVGQLTSFLSYSNQYTKPFNEISGVITELQNALACAQRVFDLIEEKAEIETNDNELSLSEVEGNVAFENVDFSYDDQKSFIRKLNLEAKPQQKIALVGPTGCGKTTLINLLMRFYDVKGGSISIEGLDIQSMTRKSLRSGIGMVLQDTWLKTGTIRDNIIMGKPDATEEEMIEAAKASHAHSFIKRLPMGYDTWITEDGDNLSQGQKQLLCITRVMLMKPPMLILDEATSSIDTRTEIQIQKAFARLMEGRTSFIVAHRLSTIREADVILVMNEGKIIERGNHESLLAQNGFYKKLYQSQF